MRYFRALAIPAEYPKNKPEQKPRLLPLLTKHGLMLRCHPASGNKFVRNIDIMRKSDLVAAVADIADIAAVDADNAVSSLFEHITNALARGDSVNISGFGAFSVKTRVARRGRNPKTGETIHIDATRSVQFKAGKYLKEHVNS